MAKFKLDKNGIKAVTDKMRRRANAVKQEFAFECSEYLLNFGYHVDGGSPNDTSPGFTGYYAANWNQGINVVNRDIIGGGLGGDDVPFGDSASVSGRSPFDDTAGRFFSVLSQKKGDRYIINEAQITDTIFVTNSVYYGKWLNDGGTLGWTFAGRSQPNRFLELCFAHLNKASVRRKIISTVKKDVL